MALQKDRAPRFWAVFAAAVAAALTAGTLLALHLAAESRGLGVIELLSSAAVLEEVVASWGRWGPIASILLMVVHSFVPFPAEFLAIANGMLFGLGFGVLLTWTGAMLGGLAAFALARWFGAALVKPMMSERKWRRMHQWVEAGGASALLTARLIPVISFNLVNYAAGLLGIGWWRFIWTTAIGILPVTVASVLVGSHMLAAPWWVWPALFGAVALLWLTHFVLRRRSDQRHERG